MKKTLLTLLASVALSATYAQTFYNNGAPVAVTTGGVMIVKSDNSTGSGSLENAASGSLKNAGTVVIEGSFVNTLGTADGAGTNTGKYFVQKDWVNNATWTPDQSLVTLYGTDQNISGTGTNTFYNLTDSTPVGLGTKKQTDGDVTVTNALWLSGSEHATTSYWLNVTNSDPASIVQYNVNTSFVSSTAGGRLVRNTNQKAEYIFPTGVNDGGVAKVREASIVPANTQARYYKVRYAENVPTTTTTTDDGYDTIKKSGGIQTVNDVFYHIVDASDNSPADLSIHSDQIADGPWASIGMWTGTPSQWVNMQQVVAGPGQSGSGRIKFTKGAWTPAVNDSVFALVDTIPIKRDFTFPTAFLPGGVGVPVENTYFTIINQGDIVALDELSVFNRWGEMVFDSQRDGTDKWDGHYHGKLQDQGNYVFLAKVRNKQTNKLYPTVTGNVALVW